MLKEDANDPEVREAISAAIAEREKEIAASLKAMGFSEERINYALYGQDSVNLTLEQIGELEQRRLNNEIYKQSVLSAAYDEGMAEGIAEGRAEWRAEFDEKIAAGMRALGYSEDQIKSVLNR